MQCLVPINYITSQNRNGVCNPITPYVRLNFKYSKGVFGVVHGGHLINSD